MTAKATGIPPRTTTHRSHLDLRHRRATCDRRTRSILSTVLAGMDIGLPHRTRPGRGGRARTSAASATATGGRRSAGWRCTGRGWWGPAAWRRCASGPTAGRDFFAVLRRRRWIDVTLDHWRTATVGGPAARRWRWPWSRRWPAARRRRPTGLMDDAAAQCRVFSRADVLRYHLGCRTKARRTWTEMTWIERCLWSDLAILTYADIAGRHLFRATGCNRSRRARRLAITCCSHARRRHHVGADRWCRLLAVGQPANHAERQTLLDRLFLDLTVVDARLQPHGDIGRLLGVRAAATHSRTADTALHATDSLAS